MPYLAVTVPIDKRLTYTLAQALTDQYIALRCVVVSLNTVFYLFLVTCRVMQMIRFLPGCWRTVWTTHPEITAKVKTRQENVVNQRRCFERFRSASLV